MRTITSHKQDRVASEVRGAGIKPAPAAPAAHPKLTALRVLAAAVIGALLYYAHVAFVPVALALLLALVLSGPVEALRRWRVPRGVSAAVIMTAILGVLVALVNFLSAPAQQWFAAAPHTLKVIEKKIRPLERLMSRVDELRNSAGSIGSAAHRTPVAAAPGAEESAPAMLFDATLGAVLSSVTVVILTLFLLAGGPPMCARMTAAFASELKSAHFLRVIEKVRSEVGRFYVTTALINVGLGVATALAMMWCGMPNPVLWGTMAAILNFIPYAGSTLEGQVVQPLLVGRRLKLNPILVFLALWFGGLFWGVAGIILATPTLVALKVVAKNAAGGRPLLNFLSLHASE